MNDALLFVSADVPWPPDGGGRIATLRVLESLAARRPVDLVALADNPDLDLGTLRAICRNVTIVQHPFTFGRHPARQLGIAALSALSATPYRIAKFRSKQLAAALETAKRSTNYALIHHDQFGVAEYRDRRTPSTLTTQNVEAEIYRLASLHTVDPVRRAWAGLEARKLRHREPQLCASFDHVFTLSRGDSDLLSGLGVPRPGVLPLPARAPADAPEPALPGPTILTMGSMSWFGVEDGILWFHRKVWPRIRSACTGVSWIIAGPHPTKAIRRLGNEPGIVVPGYVPDIDAVIERSRVAVIPLHIAGGVRVKLLQLMARGRPSVATTVGAQGIDFRDGEGCFRRDQPGDFAQATIDLLLDDDLWRRTGHAGWSFVRTRHSDAALSDALEAGMETARKTFADRQTLNRR